MMIGFALFGVGAALLAVGPAEKAVRHRRCARDVSGISSALHASMKPPADDRQLLELLKKIP